MRERRLLLCYGQCIWLCFRKSHCVKGGVWGALVSLVQWVPFGRKLMQRLGLQTQSALSQEEQQVCSTSRKAKTP